VVLNMRLTDLDPRWLWKDGIRIGFIFLCPTEKARHDGSPNPTPWRQTCFVQATPHDEQDAAVNAAMVDKLDEDGEFHQAQLCNPGAGWIVSGGIEKATFETISVTPSLDGSAGGLWHGFITAGEIVGGI
jgi:hypothetical protein